MSNPVNSFLAGFRAVDQLETNRQNRQFREQQMEFAKEDRLFQKQQQSRTRQLWERQDREFDRLELERYRQEKLVEFDAVTEQLVKVEVPKLIEQARERGGDEAAEKVAASWFGTESVVDGKPAGFARVANEAMRRMIQADPEFAEHLSLAAGVDVGDGPLVADRSRPVASVGLVPDALDPRGQGGMFFTVNSVNGEQPMTDNRSAAANDPVTIKQFGMPELVKAFGKGVMGNQVRIAEVIRDSVGANEPTGNPITGNAQATAPVAETAVEPVIEPQVTSTASGETFTSPDTRGMTEREAEAARNEVYAQVEESNKQFYRDLEAADPEFRDQRIRKEQQDAIDKVFAPDSTVADRVGSGIRAYALRQTRQWNAVREKVLEPGAEALKQGVKTRYLDPLDHNLTFVRDAAAAVMDEETSEQTVLENFFDKPDVKRDLREDNFSGSKVNEEPTPNGKRMRDDGARPADFTPKRVGQGGQPAFDASMRAPAQTSPTAASNVMNNNKPSFVEIYDALGLMKATQIASGGKGGLSIGDVVQYANTGRWGEAPRRELEVISKDGITTVVDVTGDAAGMGRPVSQFRTGEDPSAKPTTVSDQQGFLNFMQDSLPEETFGGEGQQAQAISAMSAAMEVFQPGFRDSKAGLNQAASSIRPFEQGMNFIRRFDADTAQNLFQGTGDFNPFSDPEFPMSPGSIALGTYAALSGIDSQKQADEFLLAASDVLKAGNNRVSSRDLVATMARIEEYAKFQAREKGVNLAKARREAVEEWLEGGN